MDKKLAIDIMSEKTSENTIWKLKQSLGLDHEQTVNKIQEAMNMGIKALEKTSIKNCEGCYYKKYCRLREVEDVDYCSNYAK